MPVKKLPWPNFVAAGKQMKTNREYFARIPHSEVWCSKWRWTEAIDLLPRYNRHNFSIEVRWHICPWTLNNRCPWALNNHCPWTLNQPLSLNFEDPSTFYEFLNNCCPWNLKNRLNFNVEGIPSYGATYAFYNFWFHEGRHNWKPTMWRFHIALTCLLRNFEIRSPV